MFNCRFFGQTGLLWQASGTQIRLSQAGTVEIGATRLLGEIMTPKAVFWDMDGTLIDSEPLHDEALVVALRGLGIEPPADLHERVLGIAAYPVYEMLREEVGLDLSFDKWIVRKYAHYLDNAHALLARPGAVEIYRDLKARGVVQGVVSNSDRLIVDANLRALGLHEAGMRTISRNDVRDGKPSPEPYLRASWLTQIDPSESVVMEDSWTGSEAGLAAGMKTIFWPEAPQDGPNGALVANSAEEVRAYLGLD
jgi:HAD superfamily hydrolase (TIGR01509 family)